MVVQHNEPIDDVKFEPKEGQRGLLCCNKKSLRCPSLCYYYFSSAGNLDRAYDILFDAMLEPGKD